MSSKLTQRRGGDRLRDRLRRRGEGERRRLGDEE